MRRLFLLSLLLTLLVGCAGQETTTSAASVLDTWANAVIQGDYSAAEALMASAPVSLASWREDTEHWRSGTRGGMASYTILDGPTPAGEVLNYTIQWNYKNTDPLFHTLCQRIQVAGERVTVLTDYKGCASMQPSGARDR